MKNVKKKSNNEDEENENMTDFKCKLINRSRNEMNMQNKYSYLGVGRDA